MNMLFIKDGTGNQLSQKNLEPTNLSEIPIC